MHQNHSFSSFNYIHIIFKDYNSTTPEQHIYNTNKSQNRKPLDSQQMFNLLQQGMLVSNVIEAFNSTIGDTPTINIYNIALLLSNHTPGGCTQHQHPGQHCKLHLRKIKFRVMSMSIYMCFGDQHLTRPTKPIKTLLCKWIFVTIYPELPLQHIYTTNPCYTIIYHFISTCYHVPFYQISIEILPFIMLSTLKP